MMEELRLRKTQEEADDIHDEKNEVEAIKHLLRKIITKKYNDVHFRHRCVLYMILCVFLLSYFSYAVFFVNKESSNELIPAFINTDVSGEVFISEAKLEALPGTHKHRLDKSKSDYIPINRNLEDYRPTACKIKLYKRSKLKISAIIVVNSAPVSVILRLIHSLIYRTRKEHLAEIIIFTQKGNLRLNAYLETHSFSIVKIISSRIKRSLSSARNVAARAAVGDILVFLPEASEILPGWAEPLLEAMEKGNVLAGLSMDEINPESFAQVEHVPWHLISLPRWDFITGVPIEIPKHEKLRRSSTQGYPDASPIKTPILQFAVWAASKENYLKVGGLDEGMIGSPYQMYGDLVELSIRWWSCHGEVYYLPCSKVATISLLPDPAYSETEARHQMNTNSRRTADRWAGSFINYYFEKCPECRNIQSTSSEQLDSVIDRLSCRNMHWYVTHVARDWLFGVDKVLKQGSIKATDRAICVDNMGHDGRYSEGRPGFYGCHGGFTQFWILETTTRQLKTETGKCLVSDKFEHDVVALDYCSGSGNQWKWEVVEGNIGYLKYKGQCLEHRADSTLLFVSTCSRNKNQMFLFEVLAKN